MRAHARTFRNFHCLLVPISYKISWEIYSPDRLVRCISELSRPCTMSFLSGALLCVCVCVCVCGVCGGGGREGGREKTVREIVFSLRERERGSSFRQTTRKSRCKHAITRKHAFAQHTHQIYTSTLARARKAHTPTHEKHSFYQHTKNKGQPGLKQKETKTAPETLHVRAPHRDLMHILLDARTACAIDTHRADTQIPGKLFAFIFAWFVEGSHPLWHLASALPPPAHTHTA